MPKLLLLHAFGVLGECLEEVLGLSNLSVGIGVDNLGKVLHESEVCSHGVCQSSDLAQLRKKLNLDSCLPVLDDEQGLIEVSDAFIVASLEVVLEADLSS